MRVLRLRRNCYDLPRCGVYISNRERPFSIPAGSWNATSSFSVDMIITSCTAFCLCGGCDKINECGAAMQCNSVSYARNQIRIAGETL